MSYLVFDGTNGQLTLHGSPTAHGTGSVVGHWPAANHVDVGPGKGSFHFIPNGYYHTLAHDRGAPSVGNGTDYTSNGAYGPHGIIRLQPFVAEGKVHEGVGIHSGRANYRAHHPGSLAMTYGCIRTTDDAMAAIQTHMKHDPLTYVIVQSNGQRMSGGQKPQAPHLISANRLPASGK